MKTVTVIVAKLSEKTDNRSETMALNSPGGSTLQCGTGQGLICTEPLFSSGYYYTVLWISYTLCKKSQAHVPGCEEPLKAKSPTDLARKVDSCMLRVFLAGWYTTCNSRQHLVERQSLFSSAFWTLNPTKPIHTPFIFRFVCYRQIYAFWNASWHIRNWYRLKTKLPVELTPLPSKLVTVSTAKSERSLNINISQSINTAVQNYSYVVH